MCVLSCVCEKKKEKRLKGEAGTDTDKQGENYFVKIDLISAMIHFIVPIVYICDCISEDLTAQRKCVNACETC